eukprot:1252381-Rhodomonas_salina.1
MQELVNDWVLKLHKVPGVDNVADAFTKSVPFQVLEKHCKYLWGCCCVAQTLQGESEVEHVQAGQDSGTIKPGPTQ